LHICHIITRLILGGAQENTLLTCEGQSRLGHRVTLITGPALGPEGELMTRAQAGGYEVVVLDSMRRELHPWRDWQSFRSIRNWLKTHQPDVVHTHSSKAGILGRQAAKGLSKTRVIHTVHGLPYHRYQSRLVNRVYRWIEARAAKQSDAILCVADAMTAQALAAGVGRPEQYTTVYSGMDVSRFIDRPAGADAFRQSLSLPEGAVLITQVARLAELKGHDDLLDLAGQVDDPRIHFCFVGDGHFRGRLEQRIEAEGLTGRVHLTGLLPPTEIPAVMHASDIVIHCSYREGLARALPQALLAGKPVITYDVDGASEVVPADGSTGVLVKPQDIAGLRDAVQRLSADPALRDSLGATGQARCREQFDTDHMVHRITRICQQVVASAEVSY
jgi:glycosyltransferase involved in cell wall biosynthesis